MGCTKSKLRPDICERDETSEMHADFIKREGLDSYYAVMGMEEKGETHNTYKDNSNNFNLGLINVEEKTEYDTENVNSGLTIREYIEIGIVVVVAVATIKAIYRCCAKFRKKKQIKKNKNIEEVVKSAVKPGTDVMMKTIAIPTRETTYESRELVNQYLRSGIIESCPAENNDRQLVPFSQEKTSQISVPVSINASRVPILPNSYYN